jgi:hypothetical protein
MVAIECHVDRVMGRLKMGSRKAKQDKTRQKQLEVCSLVLLFDELFFSFTS